MSHKTKGPTKFPMSSWERESCVGAVKRQEDVKLEEPAPKKRAVMVKHLDWRVMVDPPVCCILLGC